MSFYTIAYSLKNLAHRCWINTGGKKANVGVILLSSLFAFSATAHSQTPSTGSQSLFNACQAFNANTEDANAKQCLYYIKGFLAGVWHLDEAMVMQEKNQATASWEDRAYNSRVGKRAERGLPVKTNLFCPPNKAAQARVIANLANTLPAQSLQDGQLNAQIFKAIKKLCPAVNARTN